MYKGIENFPHMQGAHCASNSLRAILQYYGYDWPEELVFGIASGLGAYYTAASVPPTRLFVGRTAFLEDEFFDNIGVFFQWNSGPALAWARLQACLEAKHPVLARADLQYLDYYDTVSMFGGHTLVLTGYDDANNSVTVSDVNEPQLRSTSSRGLRKALESVSPLIPFRPNSWAAVPPFDKPDITKIINVAIRKTAHQMLEPPTSHYGLSAIRSLAEDLAKWPSLPNWRQFALGLYETTERRGSGGAAFRNLYARFLTIATAYNRSLRLLNADQRMAAVANRWSVATRLLLEAVRTHQPEPILAASEMVSELADSEATLFRDILSTSN